LSLKIRIGYVNEWKAILNGIEGRFDEARFICNKKNVVFRCVDSQNISMINISFPVWAFDTFDAPEKQSCSFGIKIDEFKKNLVKFSDNNPVYLESKDLNDFQIMINGNKKTDVKTWKVENEKENPPPSLKYTAKIALDPKAITKILSNIGNKSKYVTINCSKNFVQFCGNEDGQKNNFHLERGKNPELLDLDSIDETSSNYLLEYMTNIIREIGKKSQRVQLEYAPSKTMRMSFDMPSLAKVDYYLAPRIEY